MHSVAGGQDSFYTGCIGSIFSWVIVEELEPGRARSGLAIEAGRPIFPKAHSLARV
jgi:hypothetical protein